MSVLRRKKSKQAAAADWLATFLKLGAVGAAARDARKTAAKRAKKADGKSTARRLAPVLAIGAVGVVAAKKLRGAKGTEVPAYDPAGNGAVTPDAPATTPA